MAEAATTPLPGTAEYDAAMVKAWDDKSSATSAAATGKPLTPAEPTKPTKPEGVPDKFWNAETGAIDHTAWGKSTLESERKITELSTTKKLADDAAAKATADAATAHAAKKAELTKAVSDLKAKQDAKPEDVAAAEKALADHGDAPKATAAEAAVDAAGLDMPSLQAEYDTAGTLSEKSYEALAKVGISK
jgi:hypothetical protein